MTTQSPEKTAKRKSTLIGFVIGFVVAFSLTYFLLNKGRSVPNEPTSGELMQQETAMSKLIESADAPVYKSTSGNGRVDELATLLIMQLFMDSEKGRKEAKKELVKIFHKDAVAMKALIEKCSTEFDKKDRNDNGIFQGIDVLLMVSEQSPETLRAHKDAMYAFFEKTKGQYRERTQARIKEIRNRVGEY